MNLGLFSSSKLLSKYILFQDVFTAGSNQFLLEIAIAKMLKNCLPD